MPILRLKYWDKAEVSPFSHQNNWNVPRYLAILNPAFFDLLRPSLVHVVLSFLSTRILKKFSRVQVAPEIKASFKEQRSRRRAPIKMMKIFNFYLGILVRTRVYTNTDLMGLSVCVLYCFFFFSFLHFLLRLYNVSISKQHSMSKCKGAAKRAIQAQDHTGLDSTPRRTHNEWLQGGVTSKAWSAGSDSWVASNMPAWITLYTQRGHARWREICLTSEQLWGRRMGKTQWCQTRDGPAHSRFCGKAKRGRGRETKHKIK